MMAVHSPILEGLEQGVIRDHNGDLVYAYAIPLGHEKNNQTEVEADIWGLSWCLSNGI